MNLTRTRINAAAVCLALLLAWPAMAAEPTAPQARLAFVLEASAAMAQPWLDATALAAASEALDRELAALPLRAQAGVWLARQAGAQLLVAPAPAKDLKALRLSQPPAGGPPALADAVAMAGRWAGHGGPGAVVLICSGNAGGLGDPGRDAAGLAGAYLHVLVLGHDQGPYPALERAALAGGGAIWRVREPSRARTLLHQAVRVALSPSSLLAQTRDQANRPVELTYQVIQPGGGPESRRPALANRPVQLPAGVYALEWPKGSAIGPGQPPSSARVEAQGQTILRAGGQGRLALRAKGKDGAELPWSVNITSVPDGRILANNVRLPLEQDAPAGPMIISVINPALNWNVDLAAGQTMELTLGPWSKLRARLAGPGGPWRASLLAVGPAEAPRAWAGQTGGQLPLPPGRYTLRVDVLPPLGVQIVAPPGGEHVVDLPAVGGLLVREASGQAPRRYDIADAAGHHLGQGHTGKTVALAPGRYRIAMQDGGGKAEALITPERLTRIDAPHAP